MYNKVAYRLEKCRAITFAGDKGETMNRPKKRILFFAILLAAVLFAGSAWAMLIDFRDTAWSGATGNHAFSVNYDSMGFGDVSANAWRGGSSAKLGWWNTSNGKGDDGLGVLAGEENDEIDTREYMYVGIENGINLDKILFTDLFPGNGGTKLGEKAHVELFGAGNSFLGEFHATATTSNSNSNGDVWLDFSGYGISSPVYGFKFEIHGENPQNIDDNDNDFSVGAIDGRAVPVSEPATMVLLGIGLIGLAGASRRKFKKSV